MGYLMKTKICSKCKKRLSVSKFSKQTSRKDGLQSKCQKCTSAYVKQYRVDNYEHELERSRIRCNNVKNKLRAIIAEVKHEHGCVLCDETEPYCLDFHHLNGKDKVSNVSSMVAQKVSVTKLKKEINKCVCVCANCHRKIHIGLLKVYKYHLCKVK